jgi:EAL domain-containing protein (putative c-di-GMP-specific phosphodiesterase class I)
MPEATGLEDLVGASALDKTAELVNLSSQLLQMRARVSSLDALGEFALALSGEIDAAIESDAFCYMYQPIVSTGTAAIEGYETLLRWRRRRELVAPALFLPIAEATGAIHTIQQRLLDDLALACAQVSKRTFISINWSPRQLLKASAASALIDRVKELQIDPSRLMIEIAARSAAMDPDLIVLCVQLLKENGFQIALDGFGGHYASLSYLSRLPIDVVKLDASLIAEGEFNERALRILGGIIDFAHLMRTRVVAKGVETQPQARMLRRLGCDLLQGYATGAPARAPLPTPVDD